MKTFAVIVLFALSLLGVASALAARAQRPLVFVPARTAPKATSADGRAALNLVGTIDRMRPGTSDQQPALRAMLGSLRAP